jgi:hypothetical protein
MFAICVLICTGFAVNLCGLRSSVFRELQGGLHTHFLNSDVLKLELLSSETCTVLLYIVYGG